MNYTGTIIEESLEDALVLHEVKVLGTKVEPVTAEHQTPWLSSWTLVTFEVPERGAAAFAKRLSESLEMEHPWYADFKNDKHHFIVFKGKIFKVSVGSVRSYKKAKEYGMSLGIPGYQLDFV